MTEQRKFAAAIRGNSINSTDECRAFYDADFDYTLLEGKTTQTEPKLIEHLKEIYGARYISCASSAREDESHIGLRLAVSNAAANTYINWSK